MVNNLLLDFFVPFDFLKLNIKKIFNIPHYLEKKIRTLRQGISS